MVALSFAAAMGETSEERQCFGCLAPWSSTRSVFDIAITAPELPLISEGKAVDVSAFDEIIAAAIAPTLPRAYQKPDMTLAETREPATPKPPKPPKPPKEEKPEPPPHVPGALGAIHAELVCETGLASERLLVMSEDHDPYAIDTRENRCRAEWLREAMQAGGHRRADHPRPRHLLRAGRARRDPSS